MNPELPPYFNSDKFPFITIFFDSTQIYNSAVSVPAAGDIIRDLLAKFRTLEEYEPRTSSVF
jgi:hypothetical protein